MSNFLDVDQNTDEWLQLRAGKLTSSSLSKVMANYGKAFGNPGKDLAVEIAIEQITGTYRPSTYTNAHMERGHQEEPIARMLYEDQTFCEVKNGGFFYEGDLGASPDGLVDDDGVIEIKSAIPSVHFGRLKRNGLDPTYKWQCWQNLKISGREWIDFISYCADFPMGKRLFVHRTYAKDCAEQFSQIDSRVSEFMAEVKIAKSIIEDIGAKL